MLTIFKSPLCLSDQLLQNHSHSWIRKDRDLSRSFKVLLDSFPRPIKIFYQKRKKLLFIKGSGNFACSVNHPKNTGIILIYPNLIKLLKSPNFLQGVAVLAHEVGHIFYDHGKRKISTLDAQLEADNFACKLGLKEELIEFLYEHKSEGDCQLRLKELLSKKQAGIL